MRAESWRGLCHAFCQYSGAVTHSRELRRFREINGREWCQFPLVPTRIGKAANHFPAARNTLVVALVCRTRALDDVNASAVAFLISTRNVAELFNI
jgi:hypothetical protein